MRLLALLSAVLLVACITDPTPGRSSYCTYQGDTIGYAPLIQAKDSLILSCFFVTEIGTHCHGGAVHLTTRSDCVEGTKWKG